MYRKLLFPVLFALLILSGGGELNAQEFAFNNVSKHLSLPSLECYNILQDGRGFIWISTEQGLVRYNGWSSTIFDGRNGLPEKAVYASLEHPRGTLWFATAAGRLLRHRARNFSEAVASSTYQRKMTGALKLNNSYMLNAVGDRIFANSFGLAASLDTSGRHLRLYRYDSFPNMLLERMGKILVPVPSAVQHTRGTVGNKKELLFVVRMQNRDFRIALPHSPGYELRILTASVGEYLFFSYGKFLVRIDRNGRYHVLQHAGPIVSLYAEAEGLWVGTVKGGVYFYAAGIGRPIVSLSRYSVTGTCRDREGSIWCTTLEDGVFMLRGKKVLSHLPINGSGRQMLLREVDGRLFTSDDQGLRVLDSLTGRFHTLPGLQQVRHVWSDPDHVYASDDTATTVFDRHLRKKHTNRYGMPGDRAIVARINDSSGRTLMLSGNNIYVYGRDGTTRRIALSPMSRDMQVVTRNNVLVAGGHGLFLVNVSNGYVQRIPGIKKGASRIVRARDGTLYIAARGEGLFTIRNLRAIRIDMKLDTIAHVYYDIALDERDILWAATQRGILKIIRNGKEMSYERYTSAHGLPRDEIYALVPHVNRLFFSCNDGIFSIPSTSSLRNETPPLISLHRLTANGKRSSEGTIVLPYRNNRITVSFSLMQPPEHPHRLLYTVGSGQPVEVTGHSVTLSQLGSGDYHFRAFALNSDGVQSNDTVSFRFTVEAPLWQRWWFITGAALMLALATFAMVQAMATRKREKQEMKLGIAESKLSALQARMNPHFIFNALNSIQNYIFKNKPDEARAYLTKFSRLVRMTLQQSAEKSVPLCREIEYLQLYVELEQLRFRHAFSFDLQIEDELRHSDYRIPSMLIQPYIENAIWHGLMNLPSGTAGTLQLRIYRKDGKLVAQVRDNGIGRVKAAAFARDKSYVPSGMMLTQNRLSALQAIFPNGSFDVQVSDLYDQGPAGTLVTIIFSQLTDTNDG